MNVEVIYQASGDLGASFAKLSQNGFPARNFYDAPQCIGTRVCHYKNSDGSEGDANRIGPFVLRGVPNDYLVQHICAETDFAQADPYTVLQQAADLSCFVRENVDCSREYQNAA